MDLKISRMFGKYRELLVYLNVRGIFMRALCTLFFAAMAAGSSFAQEIASLQLAKTIYGNITPKSITYGGNGNFYAQNMMYSHNITVYDRKYRLIKTISDKIDLSDYGFAEYDTLVSGSPVEAAASHSGKYLWVTNYRMFGEGFDNPGSDGCKISKGYDSSFVYKINTQSLKVEAVVQVGCVPKYIAITPDNQYALVSNWCSGDLSVIATDSCEEIRRIDIGRYPRGIAVDSRSRFAYVAIMGSTKIARVDLNDFSVKMLHDAGSKPRHLCIDSQDKYLYATLNAESKVVKIDLATLAVVDSAHTERAPRSMTLSPDNSFLYITNYFSNSLSVIRTDSMKPVQTVTTGTHPIGVAYDPETNHVWVACYSGCIQVFKNVPQEKSQSVALAVSPAKNDLMQPSTGGYHIVVGAFREEQNLKKAMNKCIKAGYQPYIINPDGKVKKVSCIALESKEAAIEELAKVKQRLDAGAWILRQQS